MTLLFRSRYLIALLLWSVLGMASPAAALGTELLVAPGTLKLPIERGLEYLIEEPGENLTRERVMHADLAGRWAPSPHKTFNLPGELRPVWVRFGLRSTAPQESWILAIDWPLLSEAHFHQYNPDTRAWVAQVVGGLHHPNEVKLRKDPNPTFPMELKTGERAVVLLKLQATAQLTVPLILWEPKAWQADRYDYAVVMGLLFGILGVMFFYNLSLYIFTREPSFRTYSGYLLSIIAYELSVTGFGPLFIWPNNQWLLDRSYGFFAANSFLAATVFFRRFLRLRETTPRHMDWMNRGFIAFFGVMAVLMIFNVPASLVLALSLGGFVVGFVGVYTAGYLVLKGDVLARYFIIAWGAIILATFLMLLAMGGAIETGSWTKYAQPVGFVLETVLLSIALAERIKRERLSKEAAMLESQSLARKVEQEREEKLRAQEHTLAVQLKANEELELHVLDRTAELKRAMENVELANRELAKLSVTDSLTKVHNRRYFDDTMKKECDRSARSGTPLALLLVDIDHFKKINDTVGHLGGDECLRLVANTISACVGRSTDLVARFGGEEFAVVLPATDADHAMEVAERVRKAIEDIQFIYRGRRIPISVSLGVVARTARPGSGVAELISEADEALYAAKAAGRNQVMFAAA